MRIKSWAPMVGQKRLSSAFWGATFWNHWRRILHQGAQVWNSEGKDIRTKEMSTMGGAKRGENCERERGMSECWSSASMIPMKMSGQTIAGEG